MNTTPGRPWAAPVTEVISLTSWARTVRGYHRLTRRRAEQHTGISADYIKNIETGMRPSQEFLENLITGYRMDDAQTRLTWDLWHPPMDLPPVEQLREKITTPDRLEFLTLLDRTGIALAYIDPLWNILAANTTWHQGIPDAGDNLALWALPPAPQPSPTVPLLLDHDYEKQFLIAMLRGAFGRYRTNPQATSMYRQLRRNPDFNHQWHQDIHVAHGRPFHKPLRLRHPRTHHHYTLDIQITELANSPEIRCVSAWLSPRPGPPPP